MNFLKWFKKSVKVESVKPSEQAIAKPAPVVFPVYEEVNAMVESLGKHFEEYTIINIEIGKYNHKPTAELQYQLYIAGKYNEFFETFEDLRLFASRLS